MDPDLEARRFAQGISEDKPFTRLTTGELAVFCRHAKDLVQTAPVAPAEGAIEGRVIRSRISMALDSRGMYGPEVDEALGVEGRDLLGKPFDDGVVDAWEAGTIEPTEEQVRRLATLTGYPPGFFYDDGELPSGFAIMCQRHGKGRGCHVVPMPYDPGHG